MKKYFIIKESTYWSTDSLKKRVEQILEEKSKEGFEIIAVSFGLNMFWYPTAYITLCKEEKV
jgi:RNase adaptor protein for sRNA GlmZ degradation